MKFSIRILVALLMSVTLPTWATVYPKKQVPENGLAAAQAACLAPVGTDDECAAQGVILGTSCPGCGRPGQYSGVQYCQGTENKWVRTPPGNNCTTLLQSTTIAYTYPVAGCPASKVFVGPLATDCQDPAAKDAKDAAPKELGNGTGKPWLERVGTSIAGLIGRFLPSLPLPNLGTPMQACVGNPCDAATGNKLQYETDFAGGEGIPSFTRTFNALEPEDLSGLGIGWQHNQGMALLLQDQMKIVALRGDGRQLTYTYANGTWTADADVPYSLSQDSTGYTLGLPEGGAERYNLSGQVTSTTDDKDRITTYAYTGTQLTTVTGPYGHKLTLAWSNGKLARLTTPDGRYTYYAVSATTSNLGNVTYPDSKTKQHLYEDTAYPHQLTGLIDETNTRIATYGYDVTTGKAASTQQASGTGLFSLSYGSNSATVTDAAGNVRNLSFSRILGIDRLTSSTLTADGKTLSQTYDASGNLTSRTDENGHVTTWAWDSRNRPVTITKAAGTAQQRVTSLTYADPVKLLPATITSPSVHTGDSKVVSFTYGDTNHPNLPTTIGVSGFTPAGAPVSRSISISYTTAGQVATETDANGHVTTTAYWSCTTGGKCGKPSSVTNVLNQTVSFDSYDGAGRLTRMTTPNGLITDLAWDSRGRLTGLTQMPAAGQGSARNWTYAYDDAGRLQTMTPPEGGALTYAYDAASQLTSVTDALGNRIEYGYDSRGNLTSTVIKNAAGTTVRQASLTWDPRNTLATLTQASSVTQTAHDAVGNLQALTDPNGHTTSFIHDALNRQTSATDPLGGVTASGYAINDLIVSVTAPNAAQTTYAIDDLGNRLTEASPDRGNLTYGYDAKGNPTNRTDTRGITQTITRDSLDRPTAITYPTSGEDVSFTYDSCTNGIGRLCGVTDPSGTWSFAYDGLGRITSRTWTSNGQSYTTGFSWTPGDHLASMTYPSGRTVSYTRNTLGLITSIATGGSNIVSSRTHDAAGSLTGQTYGNGLVDTRAYDLQGQLTSWSTGSIDSRSYSHDANGNITAINSDSYGYDWLDRLISEPIQSFTYDSNGNRLTDASGSYTYTTASNRMATSPQGSISLDAAGNTTAIGTKGFAYNQAGRLSTAADNGTTVGSYLYAYDGHRTAKTASGSTTLFHHDINGDLMAETDTAGNTLREYVRDDEGRPLVQIASGMITYLHPDHLGTPRIGTNAAQAIVWEWDGQAFGASVPSVQTVTVNLRFPGQYYDAETGTNQNWHREYDPTVGRYVQSDPIGLTGGINTYTYVENRPTRMVDQLGLKGWYCQRPLGKPPGTQGPPLFNHQYICVTRADGSVSCGGLTTDSKNPFSGEPRLTRPDEDYYDPKSCKEVDDDKDQCFEQCVLRNFSKPNLPRYGIGLTTDCQEYADDLYYGCKILCNMRKGGW